MLMSPSHSPQEDTNGSSISLFNVFSTPGSSSIFPFGMNQLLRTPSVAATSGHGETFSLQCPVREVKRNECPHLVAGEALKSYF